jgi:hypothetical protein
VQAAARALGHLGLVEPARIDVVAPGPDGERRASLVEADRMALAAIDLALAAGIDADDAASPALAIHHHGLAGSVIALPTPVEADQAASLGIGRIRRVVTIRNVDGTDTPRIAAECLLSLSFLPPQIGLHEANAFLAELTRQLAAWPALEETHPDEPGPAEPATDTRRSADPDEPASAD